MWSGVVVAVALLSLAHGALVEESGLDDNLELVLLNDTTCLDGSSAGFYFRASGTNSSNWVIFLQGGGACYDQKSCSDRAKSALGSSTYWNATVRGNATYSADPAINPDFYQENHVFVPYCTGDVHAGTRETPSNESWGFRFTGHVNFAAIVDHLKANASIDSASRVLLMGSSAGGAGTFTNVDYLAEQLPGVEVLGAPVAGWFFPGNTSDQESWAPPSEWPRWMIGKNGSKFNDSDISDLWQSYIHPGCKQALGSLGWRCQSVHVAYPYITSPLMVMQYVFDTNQLSGELGLPTRITSLQQYAYINYFGKAMNASTKQVLLPGLNKSRADGLFLASCLNHTDGLNVGDFKPTRIGNITAGTALANWVFNRSSTAITQDIFTPLPSNPSCTRGNPPSHVDCSKALAKAECCKGVSCIFCPESALANPAYAVDVSLCSVYIQTSCKCERVSKKVVVIALGVGIPGAIIVLITIAVFYNRMRMSAYQAMN